MEKMSMGSEKKNTLAYAEMGSFFENMAMMIKAGITANEAVELLYEETKGENNALSAALKSMTDEMQAGQPLGEAMKKSGAFADYANDMINVAEYTGKLEDTLFHLSEYYRSEETMRKTFV